MTLHVFNPEHDIALAYDNKYFTAPHAGRQLRYDLEYLPALWAREGDCVLVENMASASHHAVVSCVIASRFALLIERKWNVWQGRLARCSLGDGTRL